MCAHRPEKAGPGGPANQRLLPCRPAHPIEFARRSVRGGSQAAEEVEQESVCLRRPLLLNPVPDAR